MKNARNGNDKLFTVAMRALMAGAWVTARMALNALVSEHRSNACDTLPALAAIPAAASLSAEYSASLTALINAWNAAVDSRVAV